MVHLGSAHLSPLFIPSFLFNSFKNLSANSLFISLFLLHLIFPPTHSLQPVFKTKDKKSTLPTILQYSLFTSLSLFSKKSNLHRHNFNQPHFKFNHCQIFEALFHFTDYSKKHLFKWVKIWFSTDDENLGWKVFLINGSTKIGSISQPLNIMLVSFITGHGEYWLVIYTLKLDFRFCVHGCSGSW